MTDTYVRVLPTLRTSALTAILALAVASAAWSAELIYREHTPPEQGQEAVVKAGPHIFVNRKDFNDAFSVTYYHAALDVYRKQREWLDWYTGEQLLALRAWEQRKLPDDFLREELKLGSEPDTERWAAARRQYIERLKQQANLSITLPEPARPRIAVSEGNTSPVIGLVDAPLAVVEFCRFDRTECREGWKVLREVVKAYASRIRLAHRDAVEPADRDAFTAAVAARCAQRQGKFWEYHDQLYDHPDTLGSAGALKALARTLALDAAAFDRCLDERQTAQEVARDGAEARRLGLIAFPTLFANGTYVHGVIPRPELIRILERVTLP